MMKLVRVSCPLCFSESRSQTRLLQRNGEVYSIATCANCEFVYARNCPVDTSVQAAVVPPPARQRHYHIERILRLGLAGRHDPLIVEIGCGYGDVGRLVSRWARFIGFEPSQSLAAVALGRGLDVRKEPFTGAALDRRADAIVLDNVLEHVHAPAALFDEAVAGLANGGVLIIIVPNVNDIRRLHPGWRYHNLWALPEHINYFSRRDLRRLFAKHGLTFQPFGFSVIRSRADAKYIPRALSESLGISLFGHNVFGIKQ
jgi:SAM-dependent methyltransferase